MAHYRLRMSDRDFLTSYSQSVIDCPKERGRVDRLYPKVLAILRRKVEAAFPPADMEVLRRYELVAKITQIRLALDAGGIDEVRLRGEDTLAAPHAGRNRIYGCTAVETGQIAEYIAAADALDAALKTKHHDYRSFIAAATTLEQIAEVWPEGAAALEKRIVRNLPSVVSEDLIARVKADAAQRRKAA